MINQHCMCWINKHTNIVSLYPSYITLNRLSTVLWCSTATPFVYVTNKWWMEKEYYKFIYICQLKKKCLWYIYNWSLLGGSRWYLLWCWSSRWHWRLILPTAVWCSGWRTVLQDGEFNICLVIIIAEGVILAYSGLLKTIWIIETYPKPNLTPP